MFQFTKDDIMYFVELGVMMILGLVVVFTGGASVAQARAGRRSQAGSY